MKRNKILAIILAIAMLSSVFVACSSGSKYEDKSVSDVEVVTDESGETVSDKDSKEKTTAKDKTTKSNKGGSSNGGSGSGGNAAVATTKSNDKKETTTKKKKATTTTTKETTEAPKPIAPEKETTKKKDIKMSVGVPYFSTYDQSKYELVVKVEGKELKYEFVGCRGQAIEIIVPKAYDGKTASFTVDMKGKKVSADAKIKKDAKVSLQNIVIVNGEDD